MENDWNFDPIEAARLGLAKGRQSNTDWIDQEISEL
jgi:hypothetical protein